MKLLNIYKISKFQIYYQANLREILIFLKIPKYFSAGYKNLKDSLFSVKTTILSPLPTGEAKRRLILKFCPLQRKH